MAVALAAAFVRLEPDTNTSGFEKAGKQAGEAAGKTYADGFYRDANGKLRQANGRFATDAQKKMIEGGAASGRGFGTSFTKEGGGIISRGFGKLKSELGPLLIPVGIGAAVAAIGKIGMTYEDNLNILQQVSKATAKQMSAVGDTARALGADVELPGVSAAGAAEAMTELAKAGLTVEQSMAAAKGTLQLARVASLDEAQAAEITANAVNAFGLEAKDTGFVVDELAAAANSSSIEVSEASNSFKMAAAVFSGFQGPSIGAKESITELNTAVAILGNNGIKGSDAGTSLKQALLQLTGPSDKAAAYMDWLAFRAHDVNVNLKDQETILNGGKKARDATILSIQEHNKAAAMEGGLAYDNTGKMRSLRDILDLLAKGTKDLTQEEKNQAITQIFGADASRAVIALMKGGLPVYDKQRRAVMETGAAAAAAAAKNKGLKGAIDNVQSQFENAAIGIYNVVKGPLTTGLNNFANILSTTFTWIGQNIDVIKDWAVAISAVTAAVILNNIVIGVKAAGSLGNYIKTIRVVASSTRLWAAAQAALNVTLLLNPIGLIVIAVVAFIAAFVLAYKHVGWFRKAVDTAWAAIKVAIKATLDWIMGTLWPSLQRAWAAIAAGALWLWRNAILPAWNGIKTAISVVVTAVMAVVHALVATWNGLAAAGQWLLNFLSPVFKAIQKLFEIWWLAVQIVFVGLYRILQFTIGGAIKVFAAIWEAVWARVKFALDLWWAGAKVIFGLFMKYIGGPVAAAIRVLQTVFGIVLNAIRDKLREWYGSYVQPVIEKVKTGWRVLGTALSLVWTGTIRPMFQKLIDFVGKTIPSGFSTGVAAVKKAWEGIKDAAKKPVAFVVNQVVNPFIVGLNKAAAIVGVKDRVEPIKGFRAGGEIPGYANGGRIAGMPAADDNRQAMISGIGPVKLMGGEFVVNARDTRKALPLLKWINSGMKSGKQRIASMIGRKMATNPGDGSEGWAFKDGGLVGFVKDVWGALSDPATAIKKPFEAMLSKIPGAGMIRDWVAGYARKIANGAISWLTGGSGGGKVGAAQSFLRAQNGKPYVWASAGPGGYDCSGIVSAVYNIMKGKNPYAHTFSTGGLPGSYFNPSVKQGALVAGWSHPGQSPAGPNVGHMAGQVGNLPFESRGSVGVVIGNAARRIGEFANIGAARLKAGGLVPKLYDGGGRWETGTLGLNQSGHTEHVMTGGPGGDMDKMLDMLAKIHARLGELGGDVAEAMERPTRRAVRLGRTGAVAGATGRTA